MFPKKNPLKQNALNPLILVLWLSVGLLKVTSMTSSFAAPKPSESHPKNNPAQSSPKTLVSPARPTQSNSLDSRTQWYVTLETRQNSIVNLYEESEQVSGQQIIAINKTYKRENGQLITESLKATANAKTLSPDYFHFLVQTPDREMGLYAQVKSKRILADKTTQRHPQPGKPTPSPEIQKLPVVPLSEQSIWSQHFPLWILQNGFHLPLNKIKNFEAVLENGQQDSLRPVSGQIERLDVGLNDLQSSALDSQNRVLPTHGKVFKFRVRLGVMESLWWLDSSGEVVQIQYSKTWWVFRVKPEYGKKVLESLQLSQS